MNTNTYEDETYRCVTFTKGNDEWERVRSLCLEEDNWLRENYVPEKCVVEDHDVFSITYVKETNAPICFTGIYNNGRYPKQVGRCLNRFYLFPEYRSSDLRKRMSAIHNLIVPAMLDSSPIKRELMFISMQTRERAYEGEETWWKLWKRIWLGFNGGWTPVEGLTQVVPGEDYRGFQNIIYKSYSDYKFENWNPKILSYEEHRNLYIKQSSS